MLEVNDVGSGATTRPKREKLIESPGGGRSIWSWCGGWIDGGGRWGTW